ncbi:FGGY-family carbohydrate kinase [Microbacterium sp. NRRL B-14842]|uniref:xylulokinase n=1 Tax=Microbacterium sp. NRRL B-14842 TaxID=3162881 RepID=UPI003D28734F
MVPRGPRRRAARSRPVPRDPGVDADRGPAHGRRGRSARAAHRRPGRHGRRRRTARRGRLRNRGARGRRLCLPRHLVVDLLRGGRPAARRRDADLHLRQRRPGLVRADRDHAGRRRLRAVDRRSPLRRPAHPETGRLVAEAASDVDTDDLYFLPYLLGERSPLWDPDARGAFVGLARHHGRAHLVRAVLEGTAFNLLTCIQAFRGAGATIDRIDAVGGGAQSDVYLAVLADVWGVPVRRRTIVEEANSLGAAVTGAVGLGLTDFSAARALSEVTAEFTPDPSRHAVYAERHARFTDAYTALAPWFAGRPH